MAYIKLQSNKAVGGELVQCGINRNGTNLSLLLQIVINIMKQLKDSFLKERSGACFPDFGRMGGYIKKIMPILFSILVGSLARQVYADSVQGDSQVVSANGVIIYAGVGGVIYYSTDGTTWNRGKIDNPGQWASPIGEFSDLAYNGHGSWMLSELESAPAGQSGARDIWVSTDNGAHWHPQYPNKNPAYCGYEECLGFKPTGLLGVQLQGNFIAFAYGGFPYLGHPPYLRPPSERNTPPLWTSKGSSGGTPRGFEVLGAAQIDNTIVALANASSQQTLSPYQYVRSSDGGASWTVGVFGNKAHFQGIAYGRDPSSNIVCYPPALCIRNGLFVVVGPYLTVMASETGNSNTWRYVSGLDKLPNTTINRVLYDKPLHRWIAVGNNATAFYSDTFTTHVWSQTSGIQGPSRYSLTILAADNDYSGAAVAAAHGTYYDFTFEKRIYYTTDGIHWSLSECIGWPDAIIWVSHLKKFFEFRAVPLSGIFGSIPDPWHEDVLSSGDGGKTWIYVTRLRVNTGA
ncbi:exo-alpha-sialidase [Dyella sp. M7H15-1]|uniref:sialidase family protein n=1 Tax=Dyella sp. M7H15-1 TaxID=2501295 RepID=UPI0010050E00|nr:sialidase family protein [Dyella sp. M7H15-1]QAU24582.1 exo-alpha-sialidase [Dyella sp. M7H15-1]